MKNREPKKDQEQLSFFDKLFEDLFAIRIAFSPVLLSIIIAGFVYGSNDSLLYELLSAGIVLLGIIVGVIFAIYVKKRGSTVEFMSKVMATPELDQTGKNENSSSSDKRE